MEAQTEISKLSFPRPLDIPRPHHSHFFAAWSPKLKRRIVFYQSLAMDAWVLLEADPNVKLFCEWPHATDGKRRRLLVNFWVEYTTHQEFLFVAPLGKESEVEKEVTANLGFMDWSRSHGIAVQVWSEAKIRGNAIALGNWKTILHCLAANARHILPELSGQILALFQHQRQLSLIEITNQLGGVDPMLIRACIFQMMATGHLKSDDLSTRSLGHDTKVRLS